MKNLGIWLMVIFLISFVSCLDVDFSCPREVSVNEEFVCSLDVSGDYDVKVDILCGGERCARIWNGESWGSTYYFVKGFDTSEVKLKVVGGVGGNCEGKLRLRETGSSDYCYEESFSLEVFGELEDLEGEGNNGAGLNVVEEVVQEVVEERLDRDNIIKLNVVDGVEINEEEILYESKNEKIKHYAIYFFAGFLIFIIVVLVVLR